MNLDWEKQRQLLNKKVMSWRAIISRNKISSVKACSTVRDYLFPKLELGLQFANVDQKTCNFWTRTIIFTLLETAGVSSRFVQQINLAAFCMLAQIPDIWRRLQTIRMTELFVLSTPKIVMPEAQLERAYLP